MRDAVIAELTEQCDAGANIAALVSDSNSTAKIASFQKKFPHRVINVGIAEQNLVGTAAGISLSGVIPVTLNAACFLTARALEQIRNDVCYSMSNVKLIGLNAGVSYGALGSTHHSIDDISIMQGLGNIEIFAPCDAPEAASILRYALSTQKPAYIRLDSTALPVYHSPDFAFTPGDAEIIRKGGDILIAALGSVVCEAMDAAAGLSTSGIDAAVLNMSSIRPLETDALAALLQKYKAVLTVEEHSLHGGIGGLVAGIISRSGIPCRLFSLGFPSGQFPKAGPRKDIRAAYSLDSVGISRTISEITRAL
jgi:transketolase